MALHPLQETAVVDAALKAAGALARARIRYAIGGALAYGYYGVPRATQDVDINVFVDESKRDRALGVLAKRGFRFEDATAIDETGMVIAWDGEIRIDVFLPSIPFSHEASKKRVRQTLQGKRLWFLSAESIAVFKLLFFRGKDMLDLERMVATMGKTLDVAYVRRWMVEMMGDDDERVRKWDHIVKTFGD